MCIVISIFTIAVHLKAEDRNVDCSNLKVALTNVNIVKYLITNPPCLPFQIVEENNCSVPAREALPVEICFWT